MVIFRTLNIAEFREPKSGHLRTPKLDISGTILYEADTGWPTSDTPPQAHPGANPVVRYVG